MAKAPADFDATFARLRKILEPFANNMIVTADNDENYHLDVDYVMPNKQRLYFGGVRRSKNYVSFYLMPVYVHPELLAGISPELRKRMQGKSCFNFKVPDDDLAKELGKLAKAGMAAYKADGYL